MKSKLTFTGLSKSKSLEIKMTNILSFYEDMATLIAYKSKSKYFEIITIENETQQLVTKNVLNFIKPLQRSDDIVSYLIERELRQSVKLNVSL